MLFLDNLQYELWFEKLNGYRLVFIERDLWQDKSSDDNIYGLESFANYNYSVYNIPMTWQNLWQILVWCQLLFFWEP